MSTTLDLNCGYALQLSPSDKESLELFIKRINTICNPKPFWEDENGKSIFKVLNSAEDSYAIYAVMQVDLRKLTFTSEQLAIINK